MAGAAVGDNGERRLEVSRPLVRLLADMVEATMKRDTKRQSQGVQWTAKASRRNGGPP